MTEKEMKNRTKQFGLRIIKLVDALPSSTAGRVLGNQVVRSGTSVAANYRAACRARSPAEFVSKLAVAEEECDETMLWLEMIADSGLKPAHLLRGLLKEAGRAHGDNRPVDQDGTKAGGMTAGKNPNSKFQNPKS
jgi:four helix bundle protein